MQKLLSFVTVAIAAQYVAAVPVWGQCGGINYTGSKTCDAGNTCTYVNDWYSQCLPGSVPGTTTTPTTPTSTPGSTVTSTPPPTTTGTGLDGKFKGKGKKFWGSCADPNTLNKSASVAVLKSDFGQVTPWDALESSRGSFTYSNADTLVNWAVTNGKLIRGHTLVTSHQSGILNFLPGCLRSMTRTLWQVITFTSNAAYAKQGALLQTSVIQNHISNVAGRYTGKLYGELLTSCLSAWDVVNEMFNENGSIRSSVFSNVLGESFVTIAFAAARAADSTAKLYINDYNLDSNNAKVQGLVSLVNRVNGGGTRYIDGVGTQMHLEAGGVGGVQAALTALATTGLEVAITELDIKGASASDYVAVTRACLAVPSCVAITSWGVGDVDSWRASNTPLLFDNNYRPKAAYNAVISALS
ncbi:glycoside hydrolase superfamily [Crucibulum laeve]|uniref:Beta-xylanase n=1 Tax=Crucibulum laeve TaxID=68775 RepID=A0A5C3LR58_9AGAR|nr:glycoside hydrolase superfamily [Crucibulum laeve]